MNRMRAALCAVFLVLACLLNHAVVASAAMPVPPSGLSFHRYDAAVTPLLADAPASAQPMAIGGLAEGGDTFSLQVGLNPWAGRVDIYFGAQILSLGPEIYLFVQDGSLKPLSQVGLLPWKVGIMANVSESLLGGSIPASALPPGVYRLFLAVTPKGSMNAMALWQADFQVGQWSEEQIEEKIMASFGEDGGFSAIALAADQGYSVTQIVCAGMTGRLASTGAITTYLGFAEPPEYAASNMLITGPQPMAQGDGQKWNLSEFVKEFKENTSGTNNPEGKSIIFILVELLSVGYSPGQIIEGIFLQNVVFESIQTEFGENTLGFPDFYITDENGQRLAPAFHPRRILESLKATLGGKTSLRLVDGKAEWSYTLNVTEGRKQCATDEFVLAMNFGEGWGRSFLCSDPCQGKHTFTKTGIHKVYAKVGCLSIAPLDFQMPAPSTVTFKSTSNTLPVEVKEEAGCPVGYWDVKMDWSEGWFEPGDEEWEFKEDGTWLKWLCYGGCEGIWRFEGDTLVMESTQSNCPHPNCLHVINQINPDCTYMEGDFKWKMPDGTWHVDTWTATKRVED
jgi:hypothetical protein